MQIESKISEMPGSAAVEALYTLAANQLQLTLPADAVDRMRELLPEEQVQAALSAAAQLADSREDVDAFVRYALLRAAELEPDQDEVVHSVSSAGERAFFEGGDVLTNLLIFGGLYLANLHVKVSHTSKQEEGKDKKSAQTSLKIEVESRVKLKDFLKLFGENIGDGDDDD
jgi:hypothetical protein